MHPQLFQFGRLILPTYGFLVALGAILSLLMSARTARLLALDTDKTWSVALLGIFVALVGSKALFVLSHWSRYGVRALGLSMAATKGLDVGFAGAALATAAAVAYALHLKLPLRRTADAFAPGLALGSSVVAIGCLEAGCGYGTPTRLPWAIVFRSPAAIPGTPLGVPLHPAQIYASLADFAIFVVLLWLLQRPHGDGEILGTGLFLGGLSNFLLSSVRGDVGAWISGLIPVSQLLAAGMVLAGGLLWMRRPQVSQGATRA